MYIILDSHLSKVNQVMISTTIMEYQLVVLESFIKLENIVQKVFYRIHRALHDLFFTTYISVRASPENLQVS